MAKIKYIETLDIFKRHYPEVLLYDVTTFVNIGIKKNLTLKNTKRRDPDTLSNFELSKILCFPEATAYHLRYTTHFE